MIVGIVAAKENSNRFPGKNKHKYEGVPLFWHSVRPLIESEKVDKVYVISDSKDIIEYCTDEGVETIPRPGNMSHDDTPIYQVIRYAYNSLSEQADIVISIMANCPGHTVDDVDGALSMLENTDLQEVRSYSLRRKTPWGYEEGGLLAFRENVLVDKPEVSVYCGAVITGAKEVHYKSDLEP